MALAAGDDPEAAFDSGLILGREMRAVGIDWNLAPVVDVNRNPDNRGIGIRSFSSDTAEVITYANRFLDGMHEAGVLGCLKHFPGLGGVVSDPHIELPVLNCSREELFEKDLPPFLSIEADIWMPTHIYIPAIQSRMEAVTLSEEVLTGFIRGELGFGGLLLADDLGMGGAAAGLNLDDVVIKSFAAGMDIVSIAENTERQLSAARALSAAIEKSDQLQQRMTESLERIDKFLSPHEGELRQDLSPIAAGDHLSTALRLSAESVRILKSAAPLPAVADIDLVYSMKPGRLVLVEENREGMPSSAQRIAADAGCPLTAVDRPSAEGSDYTGLTEQASGKTVLFFTENAHLDEGVRSFVTGLAEAAELLYIIAIRNPWDADIPGVENAICSYGYTPAQQDAVYELLTGGA